jgi:hypothetical protein
MTIDILCATFNGARFFPAFRVSLEAQTHEDWQLWIRDDGSSDDTVDLIREWADSDDRIHVVCDASSTERLGAARSFAQLLTSSRPDSTYLMFADQDDVWLPHKIERTFAAMRQAEATHGSVTPLLVHTDLTVTDTLLRTVHQSFWEYARIHPEPATLKRLIAHNVTTGSTIMMNRPLAAIAGQPPSDIAMHDWWCACVAAAFGKVVALHEATILYRQHDSNALGARDHRLTARDIWRAMLARRGTSGEFRRDLTQSSTQASAFLSRYGGELNPADRSFLADYEQIPKRSFVRRKVDLLRYRVLPERGALHALGVLWRG